MAGLDQTLVDLAADNEEEGVSFYSGGRRIFKDQAQLEQAAFAPQKTEAPRLTPANIQIPPTQAPASDLYAEVEKKLQTVSQTSDIMEASKILAEVKGSIAKEASKYYKETQALAHAEFDVPNLDAQLKQAIRMDDLAPGYRQKYGMADSDETAAIRRQLAVAKSAADASVEEKLKGNTQYQELMNKSKTIENVIAHNVQKNLDADSKKQAEAEELYYSLPPDQAKLLDEAFQNAEKNPRIAVANIKATSLNSKLKADLGTLLNQGEAKIADLALGGNVFAKRILLNREAGALGGKDIAEKRIGELEKISLDNNEALKALNLLRAEGAIRSTEDAKKTEAKYRIALGPTGDKSEEGRAASARIRTEIAKQYAQHITTKEFNSDMIALRHKSKVPVPAWLEAAAIEGKVGKIDKNAAIALISKAPTIEEKQQRQAEFVAYYNSAKEFQNQSKFFTVPALATEQLKAQIGLFPLLGQKLQNIQTVQKEALFGNAFDTAIKQKAQSAGQGISTFLFGE